MNTSGCTCLLYHLLQSFLPATFSKMELFGQMLYHTRFAPLPSRKAMPIYPNHLENDALFGLLSVKLGTFTPLNLSLHHGSNTDHILISMSLFDIRIPAHLLTICISPSVTCLWMNSKINFISDVNSFLRTRLECSWGPGSASFGVNLH